MSEKYIRENRNSCVIVRGSLTYGKFQSMEDAIFIRDLLIENDWDIDSISHVHEVDGEYLTVSVIDGKVHVLGKFSHEPDEDEIARLTRERMRNPNNSRYGLNITRVFDTFVIKKRIAGDDYIFGYYDNLDDAMFVRNFLMDHMWNVHEFSQIEYDTDSDSYRVVEVIDEKAYVLATFTMKDDIDISRCRSEFLAKISKHKLGLASHPHLDELKGMISHLEESWQVRPSDENWSFENVTDPLGDMIFNLTPWQKIVYDAVDSSTFDDIRRSLARYRSKNFDAKIQKNLDELMDMGLVVKNQDCFEKRNF